LLTAREKLKRIRQFAEEAKAERIRTLDIRKKTIVADYFLICSATSDVHMRSIADKITEKMKELQVAPHHVEGRGSGWVLLDFGDVVCHVMREEHRQFYDLESLWESLPSLSERE
jgi:ribosome-associated protein